MTAAAALTAVAAGASASPAMAATGALSSASATTLADVRTTSTAPIHAATAASHGAPFALDATKAAPVGAVTAPAHVLVAPIAKAAPDGPLSPVVRPAPAAPHKLPAPAQPVVRVGVANAASKNASVAPAAQPAAPSHPQQPTPPPAPAPAPKPYLIYDSVTPQMIPAGQNVATYATGGYAVPASQVAGRGHVLWIDTQGTDPAAQALDVEPGDATPSVAASWAFHKLSATPGDVARIYTMISEWPAVKAAIATLPQQMQPHIRYWIADPTGYNHVVPGSDATQWYWGKNWDISTANPNF
ncbi:MAG TPA: hypothetical protein VLM11_18015 [Streptosporangiaceae bacterium]|nr:hypothetical protein [Streptosporangiaceae bacterium]